MSEYQQRLAFELPPELTAGAEFMIPDTTSQEVLGQLAIHIEIEQHKEVFAMPEIQRIGKVSEILGDPNAQELYTGKISPRTRIAQQPELANDIEAALKPTSLEPYFVPAALDARTRCIDGRLLDGYLLPDGSVNPKLESRDLGPQVPGGTPLAALARRIIHSAEMTNSTVFDEDIRDVVEEFKQFGWRFGGHIDEHADTEVKTGCGAIDNIPQVLEKTVDPKYQREIRGLSKALLGDNYDDDTVDLVIGRLINLQSRADQYFSMDEDSGTYKYERTVMDELQRNRTEDDPVAKLTGEHNEVALVVNTVPNTTFDRDRFYVDHKGEVQMFNHDYWRSAQVAEALYPDRPDLQKQYITCRTLLAVATVMTLTDGSIELLVRREE